MEITLEAYKYIIKALEFYVVSKNTPEGSLGDSIVREAHSHDSTIRPELQAEIKRVIGEVLSTN